jgi:predicted  nucleic acid-binding Zn-ribbon protein
MAEQSLIKLNDKQAQLEAKQNEVARLSQDVARLQQDVKNAQMKSDALQNALNEAANMNS